MRFLEHHRQLHVSAPRIPSNRSGNKTSHTEESSSEMDQQTAAEAHEKEEYAAFMKTFVKKAKARAPEASLNLPQVHMPDKNFDMLPSTFLIIGKTKQDEAVFLSVRHTERFPAISKWEPVFSVMDSAHTVEELAATCQVDLFHGEYVLDEIERYWAGDLGAWLSYLVWLYFEQIDSSLRTELFKKVSARFEADPVTSHIQRERKAPPPFASVALFCQTYPNLLTPLSIWQAYNEHSIPLNLQNDDVVEVIRYACGRVFRDAYVPTAQTIRSAGEERTTGNTITSTTAWQQAMYAEGYEGAKVAARRQRNVIKRAAIEASMRKQGSWT